MYTWDEFEQLLKEQGISDLSPFARLQEVLSSYNKAFFLKSDDEQKDILAEIVDQCSWMIESIDPKERASPSLANFKIKYPGIIEVITLQKQAVRELYYPKIDFIAEKNESFEEQRKRFLHQSRMQLIIEPLQNTQGRTLQVPYWAEKRFEGISDLSVWLMQDVNDSGKLISVGEFINESFLAVQYFESTKDTAVILENNKLMIKNKEGQKILLDTKDAPQLVLTPQGFHVFVMSLEGQLHVCHKDISLDSKKGTHHSSLLRGENVLCGGDILFDKGEIKKIVFSSGHYKPGRRNIIAGLKSLQSQGVNLDNAEIELFNCAVYKDINKYIRTNGYAIPDNSSEAPLMHALSTMSHFISTHETSPEVVIKNFEIAIEMGNIDALYHYASALYRGTFVETFDFANKQFRDSAIVNSEREKDKAKALSILVTAAHQYPDRSSLHRISEKVLEEPRDFLFQEWKNDSTQTQYLDSACFLEHKDAILVRAKMLLEGTNGYQKNMEQAFKDLNHLSAKYDHGEAKEILVSYNAFDETLDESPILKPYTNKEINDLSQNIDNLPPSEIKEMRRRFHGMLIGNNKEDCYLVYLFLANCPLQYRSMILNRLEPIILNNLDRAITYNDHETFKNITATGIDFNQKTQSPLPLKRACLINQTEMVDDLISLGADVSLLESDDIINSNINIITSLVKAGINLKWHPTVIVNACKSGDLNRVKLLCELGADINQLDYMDGTLLVRALKENKLDLANQLLSLGADPNMGYESHKPPLAYAIEVGDLQLIKKLLAAGAEPLKNYTDGYDPQTYATIHMDILSCARSTHNPTIISIIQTAVEDEMLNEKARAKTLKFSAVEKRKKYLDKEDVSHKKQRKPKGKI